MPSVPTPCPIQAAKDFLQVAHTNRPLEVVAEVGRLTGIIAGDTEEQRRILAQLGKVRAAAALALIRRSA